MADDARRRQIASAAGKEHRSSVPSALAIGVTGARALGAMARADEATAKAIAAMQVLRSALFQLPAIGASVVAILLVLNG